ncbi:MAG: DMT family transporter [Eubacterium sp.]|nr:DMT family transporter [Eubacterium sp.]
MKNLLKDDRYKVFFAILCATGWSLAYPFIKIGYQGFGIKGNDLGGKILFAGIRFFIAGILVSFICIFKGKKLNIKNKKDYGWLILLALVNTTLHYMFAYIGLGNNSSGRSTILDSLGGFFLIALSTLFFKDDKMTLRKALGSGLGVLGIVIINIDFSGHFFDNITFAGDGMILLNALCAGFGGIITRIVSRKMNILAATGHSMTIGGACLIATGMVIGKKNPWNINFTNILVLILLILISAVCFAIYNALLKYHPISEIAIYNALIPVLGVIFATLFLGESLKWQYFIAVILVAFGIRIVNGKNR